MSHAVLQNAWNVMIRVAKLVSKVITHLDLIVCNVILSAQPAIVIHNALVVLMAIIYLLTLAINATQIVCNV